MKFQPEPESRARTTGIAVPEGKSSERQYAQAHKPGKSIFSVSRCCDAVGLEIDTEQDALRIVRQGKRSPGLLAKHHSTGKIQGFIRAQMDDCAQIQRRLTRTSMAHPTARPHTIRKSDATGLRVPEIDLLATRAEPLWPRLSIESALVYHAYTMHG